MCTGGGPGAAQAANRAARRMKTAPVVVPDDFLVLHRFCMAIPSSVQWAPFGGEFDNASQKDWFDPVAQYPPPT